jgi:germination protein M
MKKKMIRIFLLLAMLLFLLAGCGKEKNGNDEYEVFYLNSNVTTLVQGEVKLDHDAGEELVWDLLDALQTQPSDAGMRQTIPTDVQVQGITLATYQITVDFNEAYHNLASIDEILTRAAIVKTLLQNTDYLYVLFTVDGEPLMTESGATVGAMGLDSFVENPGQQINSSQVATLTLYFANADGTALVPETRQVHYSSNTSVDKLVMEQLIEGPKVSGAQATIPTGTRLITISTVDGVCYVNFDETFFNQNQEITEQVVLYSIVDSLTELQTIDRVQLSVNGDTTGKVRFTYGLSSMYEEDLGLVQVEESSEEEIEATE